MTCSTLQLADSLRILVMDEADLILSYGHDEDVGVLLQHLPKLHQTLLMSATLSDDVQQLKALVMHDPVVLNIGAGVWAMMRGGGNQNPATSPFTDLSIHRYYEKLLVSTLFLFTSLPLCVCYF
jgi:superfamily II DNA/RNA helicase